MAPSKRSAATDPFGVGPGNRVSETSHEVPMETVEERRTDEGGQTKSVNELLPETVDEALTDGPRRVLTAAGHRDGAVRALTDTLR